MALRLPLTHAHQRYAQCRHAQKARTSRCACASTWRCGRSSSGSAVATRWRPTSSCPRVACGPGRQSTMQAMHSPSPTSVGRTSFVSRLALASALAGTAVLIDLNLHRNKIGSPGASALAEALKVNAVLTILNLRRNEIGNEGAISFAKALEVNAVLTKLDLQFNEMDDAAEQSLRDVVASREGFVLDL